MVLAEQLNYDLRYHTAKAMKTLTCFERDMIVVVEFR